MLQERRIRSGKMVEESRREPSEPLPPSTPAQYGTTHSRGQKQKPPTHMKAPNTTEEYYRQPRRSIHSSVLSPIPAARYQVQSHRDSRFNRLRDIPRNSSLSQNHSKNKTPILAAHPPRSRRSSPVPESHQAKRRAPTDLSTRIIPPCQNRTTKKQGPTPTITTTTQVPEKHVPNATRTTPRKNGIIVRTGGKKESVVLFSH